MKMCYGLQSFFRHIQQKPECNRHYMSSLPSTSKPASPDLEISSPVSSDNDSLPMKKPRQDVDDDDMFSPSTDDEDESKNMAYDNPDGPFCVSKEELESLLTRVQLPPDLEFQVSLYCMLTHPRIPRYVFEYVMKLINAFFFSPEPEHRRDLYQSQQPFPTCRLTTEKLIKKFFPSPKPTTIPIVMETRDPEVIETSSLVAFDLEKLFLEDLASHDLWSPDKVALNLSTLWKKNKPEVARDSTGKTLFTSEGDPRIDITETVNSGIYQLAHDKFIDNEDEQFLLPYTMWVDETGTSKNLRHPAQPLLLKSSLLKRQHQKTRVWAYIPCQVKSSAEKSHERGSKDSHGIYCRNFHKSLSVLFRIWDEVYSKFQREKRTVCIAGEVKRVFVCPVLLFCMGDGKSQDAIACRYGYDTNRICRTCLSVTSWDADDCGPLGEAIDDSLIRNSVNAITSLADKNKLLHLDIKRLTYRKSLPNNNRQAKRAIQLEIDELEVKRKENAAAIQLERESLASLSTHYCENAFWNFKCFVGSIYSLTPHDHMHCFMLGICMDVFATTVGLFTPSQKKELDHIAKKLFNDNTSSVRGRFPRYGLSRGITNLTLLSAQEWIGLLFVYLAVGRTTMGRMVLDKAFSDLDKKQKKLTRERIAKLQHDLDEASRKRKERMEATSCTPTIADIMNQSKIDYLEMLLEPGRIEVTTGSFLLLLEDLLAYHSAAYSRQVFWSDDDEKTWDWNTRRLMETIKEVAPRIEGNCHKKQKFHSMKHLYSDTAMFGAPLNFDCMSGEHALQEYVKDLAKTVVQRDLEGFTESLGRRLHEFSCIQKLKDLVLPGGTRYLSIAQQMFEDRSSPYLDRDDLVDDETSTDGEDGVSLSDMDTASGNKPTVTISKNPDWMIRFQIQEFRNQLGHPIKIQRYNQETPLLVIEPIEEYWLRDKPLDSVVISQLTRDLVKLLHDSDSKDLTLGKTFLIKGYFSCKVMRPDSKSIIRCDPNFNQSGQRYDFCQQSFYEDITEDALSSFGKTPAGICPAKILCFYEHPTLHVVRAITHPCAWRNTLDDTKLTEIWKLDTHRVGQGDGCVFTPRGDVIGFVRYKNSLSAQFQIKRYEPRTCGIDADQLGLPIFVVQEDASIHGHYENGLSESINIVHIRDWKRYWYKWFTDGEFGSDED
jgi:hypothetical protein